MKHIVNFQEGNLVLEFTPNPSYLTRTGPFDWRYEQEGLVPEAATDEPSPSAFDLQVGGSHYKDLAIQPTEYIVKNKLNFIEGNVIKYVTRYKLKGGLEDLKKARHYIDILIELEESNG